MKIRIPVVMRSDGQWCASHDSFQSEPDWSAMEDSAWGDGEYRELQRAWVVVDVPVPSELLPEIEGEVEA